MPLIKDEQEVKKQSQFLEYTPGESGNTLILKSHLYKITKHYVQNVKRSVECRESTEEGCLYCIANYRKANEYNYMVFLNGEVGFIDIKPSVFFSIQAVCKAQRKDVRQISWTVIKEGEGLNTEYTTSKEDNLPQEEYQKLMDECDANTDKLVASMERKEEGLAENYITYMKDITEQKKPEIKGKSQEVKVQQEAPVETTIDAHVSPEQIPF